MLRIGGLFLSYFLNIMIARLYGSERMGVYFIALNLVSMVAVLCSFGLDIGLLRFISALKAKGEMGNFKKIFRPAVVLVMIIGSLAGFLMYASGESLSRWFHAPTLLHILGFVTLALPIMVVHRLVTETVRALGGVRWLILENNFLTPLVFLILIIVLAYLSLDGVAKIRALGMAFFAKMVFALLFLAVCLVFLLQTSQEGYGSDSFKELLRYSWPIYLTALIGAAYLYLDSLILGLFASSEDVAYYGVARRLAPLVSFPLVAVNAVVPPLYSGLFQHGNLQDLEILAQTTARWMYYFALPVTAMMILLGPELLKLFGNDFVKARFALSVWAVAHLVNVAMGSVMVILQMTDHQWEVMRWRLFVGLGTFVLMPPLAAYYGINGISLVSSASLIAINLMMGWSVWKCLKIKVFVLNVKWANWGILVGIGLFLAAKPLVGVIGATLIFMLGYISLVAKPLKQEIRSLI
jgi:O-antigen/teichoic acid export membrane protein